MKTSEERLTAASAEERLEAVGELLRSPRPELAELCRGRLAKEDDARVLAGVIALLGKTGAPADVAAIEPYLHAKRSRVRCAAVKAVVTLDRAAVPKVVPFLSDRSSRVRAHTILVLARVPGIDVMESLHQMASSSNPQVALSAVWTSVKLARPPVVPVLVRLARHPDPEVRGEARGGLKRLAAVLPEAARVVKAAQARKAAQAEALKKMPKEDPGAKPLGPKEDPELSLTGARVSDLAAQLNPGDTLIAPPSRVDGDVSFSSVPGNRLPDEDSVLRPGARLEATPPDPDFSSRRSDHEILPDPSLSGDGKRPRPKLTAPKIAAVPPAPAPAESPAPDGPPAEYGAEGGDPERLAEASGDMPADDPLPKRPTGPAPALSRERVATARVARPLTSPSGAAAPAKRTVPPGVLAGLGGVVMVAVLLVIGLSSDPAPPPPPPPPSIAAPVAHVSAPPPSVEPSAQPEVKHVFAPAALPPANAAPPDPTLEQVEALIKHAHAPRGITAASIIHLMALDRVQANYRIDLARAREAADRVQFDAAFEALDGALRALPEDHLSGRIAVLRMLVAISREADRGDRLKKHKEELAQELSKFRELCLDAANKGGFPDADLKVVLARIKDTQKNQETAGRAADWLSGATLFEGSGTPAPE